MRQGQVYWLHFGGAGSRPSGRRPAVVIQHDRFNRTRINTIVVVAVTSNLKYAVLPGNVRLRKNEAGLSRASVANVTQIATIDRQQILARIGRLSRRRLDEVWQGVRLVLEPPRAPA